MGDAKLSLSAFDGEVIAPAHLSHPPMDELQLEPHVYDLLLWQAGRVQAMRVQQPDRIHALAIARRLNPGLPVALLAIEAPDGQTN